MLGGPDAPVVLAEDRIRRPPQPTEVGVGEDENAPQEEEGDPVAEENLGPEVHLLRRVDCLTSVLRFGPTSD